MYRRIEIQLPLIAKQHGVEESRLEQQLDVLREGAKSKYGNYDTYTPLLIAEWDSGLTNPSATASVVEDQMAKLERSLKLERNKKKEKEADLKHKIEQVMRPVAEKLGYSPGKPYLSTRVQCWGHSQVQFCSQVKSGENAHIDTHACTHAYAHIFTQVLAVLQPGGIEFDGEAVVRIDAENCMHVRARARARGRTDARGCTHARVRARAIANTHARTHARTHMSLHMSLHRHHLPDQLHRIARRRAARAATVGVC